MQDERGLPRAVRAEQRDPFAPLDREIDAEQRLVAVRVGERAFPDLERGTGHGCITHAVAATRAANAGNASVPAHMAAGAPPASVSGRRPRVTTREHRQVHAFATLVRADEQRARRRAERLGLPDPPGVVRARVARHPHPLRLGGDHVQVADHEPGDRRERMREMQPLETAEQVGHRRGRRDDDRRHESQRRLDQDVPRGPQTGDVHRDAEHHDLLAVRQERHEDREQDERHLDHQAASRRSAGAVRRRASASAG